MMKSQGIVIGKRGGDYGILARHPDLSEKIARKVSVIHRSVRWKPVALNHPSPLSVVGGMHVGSGTLLIRASDEGFDSDGRKPVLQIEGLWLPEHRLDIQDYASTLWSKIKISNHSPPSVDHLDKLDLSVATEMQSELWVDRPDLLRIPQEPPESNISPKPEVSTTRSAGGKDTRIQNIGSSASKTTFWGKVSFAGMAVVAVVFAFMAYRYHGELGSWREVADEISGSKDPAAVRADFFSTRQALQDWQQNVGEAVAASSPSGAVERIEILKRSLEEWKEAGQVDDPNELRTKLESMHEENQDLKGTLESEGDDVQVKNAELLSERNHTRAQIDRAITILKKVSPQSEK